MVAWMTSTKSYTGRHMRFADTSFWFSIQDRLDRNHQQAAGLVRAERGRVLTSNHVVGETWTTPRVFSLGGAQHASASTAAS